MSMDSKKKFFLFKQSDHFCSVPWNHVEIFTNGIVKTCAKGNIIGDLRTQNLDDILKTEWVLDMKEQLYNDQPHNNCTECYHLSTGKEHSDLRNHYNSLFKFEDVDYSNSKNFNLRGIDLHWDNTCNLKCVYCTPMQSSSIAQEQGIAIDKLPRDKIDSIIDLIVENQWNLKEIYFSGGEPMLIKHNYELLNRLENFDLPIRINSNITQAKPNNQFFDKIKKFKNVLWTISAESTADRFEYTRFGSHWKVFLENLNHIKDLGHELRINSVWFAGSVVSMCDTLKFFINEYNITDITINQLYNHHPMLVRNVPDSVKIIAKQQLQELLASELIVPQSNSYYNIKRCHRELEQPILDPTGYKKYFDQLDQKRGTNWRNIFTELDQ